MLPSPIIFAVWFSPHVRSSIPHATRVDETGQTGARQKPSVRLSNICPSLIVIEEPDIVLGSLSVPILTPAHTFSRAKLPDPYPMRYSFCVSVCVLVAGF